MTTIVLRAAKGSPLTNTEVDNNFSNLNTAKLELGQAQASATANSLLYFNGSKLPTTSSALTFDGAILAASGTGGITHTAGGNTARMIAAAGGTYWGSTTAADLIFQYNSNENMRLTSAGLGIGTSSPGQKLHVVGNIRTTNSLLESTGTSVNFGTITGGYLAFLSGSGAEAGRFDASGNLGIGTNSPGHRLDVTGAAGSFAGIRVNASSFQNAGLIVNRVNNGNAASLFFTESGANQAYITSYGGAYGSGLNSALQIVNGSNALTYDSSGNLGLGVVPGAVFGTTLRVGPNGGSGTLSVPAGYLYSNTTNDLKYAAGTSASGAHIFYSAYSGGEYARITSAGDVGIGTSSPATRLTVRTTHAPPSATSYSGALLIHDEPNGVAPHFNAGVAYDGGGNYGWIQVNSSGGSYPLVLQGVGGNVGIGLKVPSAKLNLAMASGAGTPQIRMDQLSDNPYIEFDRWTGTGSNYTAGRIYVDGAHNGLVFAGAVSATTIGSHTFAERMRIDSSGRLGIGTSAPTAQLVVQGTGAGGWLVGSRNALHIYNPGTTAGNVSNGIWMGDASSPGRWGIFNDINANGTTANTLTIYNEGSERLRIESNGNLLVGTANGSAGARVTIEAVAAATSIVNALTLRNGSDGGVGLYFDNAVSNNLASIEARVDSAGSGTDEGNLVFSTAREAVNYERARIDSYGNFLVRTSIVPTTIWNPLSIANIYGGLQLTHPNSGARWRQISWSGDAADGGLYFPGGSTLSSVANVAWLDSTGVWVNASDARQKTNIREIHHGLASVLQAQPRAYNRDDTEGNFIGFVAQELKQVIPEVVRGSDQSFYGVDYGSLVAVAFKAIQEQQAIITALNARVAALEAA